ncbi:MAG: tRNA epoxyqueuosine(34) reductase QueG [Alphaproteobacteria bacterium]|nr:tRNA epoxyqueuosine(34) reductase QueG [Alphaproteobacteria bacterium]
MATPLPKPPLPTRETIRARALGLGFDAVGFTHPAAIGEAGKRLLQFLAEGRHGDMGWMAANAERRASPHVLWPEARSVIVLGLNYGPPDDPLRALSQVTRGAVSVYARGRDYHDIIKARLKALARSIAEEGEAEVKVFVDTAPVLEKPLAQAAGLGWQGKHTNLVSRELGSWLFLGSIFTTLDLGTDDPSADHCGRCQACLDICPTRAFDGPYQIDARRCISYLTIEHKGMIPRALRPLMGNRIYGCDDCLAVCPWNKFAVTTKESAFLPRDGVNLALLAELAGLDDAGFRARFQGSPIKRIGRDRFLRNVLIAIGNSQSADLAHAAQALLEDASALVRGAAVWALSRLLERAAFEALRARCLSLEDDEEVRGEWAGEAGTPINP